MTHNSLKVTLTVLLFLVTSAIFSSSTLFSSVAQEVEIEIDGKWYKGTLFAKTPPIKYQNGEISVDGTWSFVSDDEPPFVAGGNNGGSWKGKIGGSKRTVFQQGDAYIFSDNGIEIISNETFEIAVFDINGKLVYKATNNHGTIINRDVLKTNNSFYMMTITNNEGDVETLSFMFSEGDTFLQSK